jgi:hypothetical protein
MQVDGEVFEVWRGASWCIVGRKSGWKSVHLWREKGQVSHGITEQWATMA